MEQRGLIPLEPALPTFGKETEWKGRPPWRTALFSREGEETREKDFDDWNREMCIRDRYYTVLRRPLNRELQPGVYLLSRFEDPTGLDVTGLFWLENVSVGVAHLCQGDFLEELFYLLLSRYVREASLPVYRPRAETMVSGYSYLLKETFDQYDRGFG